MTLAVSQKLLCNTLASRMGINESRPRFLCEDLRAAGLAPEAIGTLRKGSAISPKLAALCLLALIAGGRRRDSIAAVKSLGQTPVTGLHIFKLQQEMTTLDLCEQIFEKIFAENPIEEMLIETENMERQQLRFMRTGGDVKTFVYTHVQGSEQSDNARPTPTGFWSEQWFNLTFFTEIQDIFLSKQATTSRGHLATNTDADTELLSAATQAARTLRRHEEMPAGGSQQNLEHAERLEAAITRVRNKHRIQNALRKPRRCEKSGTGARA